MTAEKIFQIYIHMEYIAQNGEKGKSGARGSADKYFVSNVEEPFDAFIS